MIGALALPDARAVPFTRAVAAEPEVTGVTVRLSVPEVTVAV